MGVGFPVFQNQHDDLKKQYYELHEQHQIQGEDHSRLLDEHRDRYGKLQQAKDTEVSQLKGADGPSQTSSLHFMKIIYLGANIFFIISSSSNISVCFCFCRQCLQPKRGK